ncbi:hypothetical protein GNP94_21915 [Paenibacillus campinasensis]|uniref:Tail fiber assembly protein n=1 Tax=Paenibacillus campinasensis TaxID=66347 RepID=A0ABW9TBR8_9BACL|nr:hypothetical protein [Paenibacillus campinasensis]MUG68631.1 hypothetical protein [Paenibacillus campinasensis]
MFQVGRMIFYDKATGQVLITTPSQWAPSVYEDPEDLIPLYPVLRDRDRDSFDVIKLEYGQLDREFERSVSWRVNTATKQIEFLYPDDLNEPEAPPVYRKPLTQEVDDLNQTIGTLLIESANDKATISSLENAVGSLLLEIAALKGGAE